MWFLIAFGVSTNLLLGGGSYSTQQECLDAAKTWAEPGRDSRDKHGFEAYCSPAVGYRLKTKDFELFSQIPVAGEMWAGPNTGTLQLGDLGGIAEPLQMDAERRLLVVCHQGNRAGNGTAVMENMGGRNMLVAKCEWIRK